MSKELNELIKELGKIVDGNQSIVDELDKLKSLYEKLKVEVAEEFEYPFKEKEKYWSVNTFGEVDNFTWIQNGFNTTRYNQGNAFKTKQEAERERDRRALLTRFRQFRDKCNGNWKPDFKDLEEHKHSISYDWFEGSFRCLRSQSIQMISPLGYFKNERDALRAIELFGDEIKRLYVEE